MVAESGDIDAGNFTSLQDSEAFGNLHWVAIDEDLDSVFRVREMDPGPAHGCPRCEIWGGFGLGLGLGGRRLVRVLELGCGGYGPAEEEQACGVVKP